MTDINQDLGNKMNTLLSTEPCPVTRPVLRPADHTDHPRTASYFYHL